MPVDGVQLQDKSDLLSTSEMLELAQIFVDCGVDKVSQTGFVSCPGFVLIARAPHVCLCPAV